jgi:nucleoside-triphosphatase THEP1
MSTYERLAAFAAVAMAQLRSLIQVAEPEPVDYPFGASDISRYHRIVHDPAAPSVDEQTWAGLLVEPYFDMLAGHLSIFGKQVLHHRLRAGLDEEERAALTERLRTLMGDPQRLEEIGIACRSLRHADTEIATLLFEDDLPTVPKWAGNTWPLFAGLVASVAAVVLTPLAWLAAGACLYQMVALQMRYHERMVAWNRAMGSLQMLLRSSSLLGMSGHPMLKHFAAAQAMAGRINRSLSNTRLELVPGASAYLDWFLQTNINRYFKHVGIVDTHRDFLRDCYTRCANLEADIGLARHLLRVRSTCWAETCAAGDIAVEQAVHPLLEQPAALSLTLKGKGAFISGQNGIGKSTLLRTVGLNLLVARAFGFCYASTARLPMLPVYASMQSEDSLLGGESLYIAELQRAQELLALANGTQRAIFIIDEIFRGTNHLESVSAAAAVLETLAAESTVIVSSHNLVLATLLEHRLAPFCVSREEAGALVLAPGVLAHTNGIALLAQRGFGPAIQARATMVFDWLNTYLAQPSGGNQVLGADAVTTACT